MKKYIGLVLVAALLFGVFALAGCGSEKKADLNTPQGAIDFAMSSNKITVTGKAGEKEVWKTGEVTEKELGIPFPPGAKVDKDKTGKLTKGTDVWASATLWSNSSVSDINKWYKDKLSAENGYKDQSTVIDGFEIGMFTVGTGEALDSVIVTAGAQGDPGATMITIISAKGTE
jgi:hypothetical protein